MTIEELGELVKRTASEHDAAGFILMVAVPQADGQTALHTITGIRPDCDGFSLGAVMLDGFARWMLERSGGSELDAIAQALKGERKRMEA